jgi:hypothetical protein
LTIGVGLGKLGCGCDATIGFGGCCWGAAGCWGSEGLCCAPGAKTFSFNGVPILASGIFW